MLLMQHIPELPFLREMCNNVAVKHLLRTYDVENRLDLQARTRASESERELFQVRASENYFSLSLSKTFFEI